MPKTKSAAILTIKDAEDMSLRGRKDIARWLRRQARQFESHGDIYARRFTAHYLYTPTPRRSRTRA